MPASAIARRTLGDSRVRDVTFGALFALFAFANPIGYRSAYSTTAERVAFAKSFGTNRAVVLFYGVPRDLLTDGGFTAWRVGGFGALVTAVWGVFASVRALRAEEEAGRWDVVLAGAVGRVTAFGAALAGVAVAATACAAAFVVALAVGGLRVGPSAFLAVATFAPAIVFGGVGALASQLAPTRRLAVELGLAVFAAAFLVRVVADTASGLGWLRWTTPLGWSEELRPFAGERPAVLVLPALATLALVAGSAAITRRRDVGTAVLAPRETAAADLRLLGSPAAAAVRFSRGSFVAWLVGVGAFALVIGLLSTAFTRENISTSLQQQLHQIGGASLTSPAAAIGFYFLLFVLATSLYACTHVASMRRAEAEHELETLFALPLGRLRWAADRVAVAALGTALLALSIALLVWVGAASQHAGVGLPRLLEAAANCLPASALFLGVALLLFGVVPRASTGLSFAFVAVAFLWQLVASLLGVPHGLVSLSPFAHVALVPAQPFDVTASIAMIAIGAAAAAIGAAAFARRDLVGG